MDLSVSTKRQTPKTDSVLAAHNDVGAELPVDLSTSAKRPKLQNNSGLAVPHNKLLGSGSFGAVYTHVDRNRRQVWAVKKVDLGMVASPSYQKKIDHAMKEVEMMEKLKHHHRIVSYIKHELISHELHPEIQVMCIYMEYLPGGSVKGRLDSSGAFSEKETKRCMRQILEGLSYLHSRRLIHRDVKGSNILFDANDDLKLADFGVSKQLNELSTFSARTNTGNVGTAKWMAPEVVSGKKYSKKADIWSAGATMVEMLTQKSLWPRLNQIQWMFQLSQQQKPEYTLHPSVSQTARNLLTGIFNYKDRIRPRAEQCLGHPWFKTPEINSPERAVQVEKKSVAGNTASISSGQRLPVSHVPPISIELIKNVDIASHCYSVHMYNGNTYVGCRRSAFRINKDYTVTRNFISSRGRIVEDILVHDDKIYAQSNSTVRVHNLTGQLIDSWSLPRNRFYGIAITGNRMIVSDGDSQSLVLYSLNGEVVNTLPCPLLTDTPVHLSAADNNSVIISQCNSSLVYKANISSGGIIWHCEEMAKPRGVTCYRDELVVVADVTKPTSLCVLSLHTGQLLHRIPFEDPTAIIADLHTAGSTLVLARTWIDQVDFYEIK